MSRDADQLPVDPETLAALLDGRLDDEERARVLAAIDASPRLLEIFADSAEVRELLQFGDALPTPAPTPFALPSRSNTRLPARWWMIPALAAAAVFLISLPFAFRARPRGDELTEYVIVSRLARPSAAAGELPREAWTRFRGAGDVATPDGRVVRIGARLVDAALLAAAGDSAVRQTAAQLAALLENIPGAAIEAPVFRQISGDPWSSASVGQIRSAIIGVEHVLDSDALRAGMWLEAARVAAARADVAFFRAPLTPTERSALLARAGEPSRSVADSLLAAVDGQRINTAFVAALAERLMSAISR